MVTKRVLIRADSSTTIGHGHVSRCLSLADFLKEQGAIVEFIINDLPGSLVSLIQEKQFKTHLINSIQDEHLNIEKDSEQVLSFIKNSNHKYDWLVVDHYALTQEWEKYFFDFGINVFVIDDLATSKHYCHYLLNQTVNSDSSQYNGLLNQEAQLLLGEKYILLRSEFTQMKEKVLFNTNYHNPLIHMFWGSTDPHNYAYKFSKFLLENMSNVRLKIITGVANEKLAALKQSYPAQIILYHAVGDMAQGMLDCDLAVGAPGMTTWERAAMGLPSVYLATNNNQINILNKLASEGFCHYVGEAGLIDATEFITKFKRILSQEPSLKAMGRLGFEKIDALGVKRVSDIMLGFES